MSRITARFGESKAAVARAGASSGTASFTSTTSPSPPPTFAPRTYKTGWATCRGAACMACSMRGCHGWILLQVHPHRAVWIRQLEMVLDCGLDPKECVQSSPVLCVLHRGCALCRLKAAVTLPRRILGVVQPHDCLAHSTRPLSTSIARTGQLSAIAVLLEQLLGQPLPLFEHESHIANSRLTTANRALILDVASIRLEPRLFTLET
eukprot:scaffold322791_cov27-Tisochrysis_lutea.AAC.1